MDGKPSAMIERQQRAIAQLERLVNELVGTPRSGVRSAQRADPTNS